VKLTTQLHLVPRSRMCGAIPPLPQYAFMAWCSVEVRGQLYFLYLYQLIWKYLHENMRHISSELIINSVTVSLYVTITVSLHKIGALKLAAGSF
jgi:hypothetical protein